MADASAKSTGTSGEAEIWQVIFRQVQDYLFLIRISDGYIFDVNPAACQVLGLSRGRLIGRTIQSLFKKAEETSEEWNDLLAPSLTGWRVLTGRKGKEVRVYLSWQSIDENRGLLVARPEEQTFPVRQALKAAEEWFRTTLYSVGDAVITTDIFGAVQQMNPVAEALTGWKEIEARGRAIHEIFNIVNEQTRAKVENPVERVLREGVVVGLANHTLLVSRQGEEYPIADSGAPIRNDLGEIVGVVLVFRDQTRERQAQKEVEKARRYASAIVETVREPLMVLDAELRVVSANRAFYRLFQVEEEETVGHFIYELGNRQWDIPALRRLLEEILPQNTKFDDFEVEHTFEKLGRRIMTLNARRIYDEGGKTQLILLAIEDITTRRLAERALQANEKHYRLLFENNPLPMWVYDLETLQFLMVNDAAVEKYGYSRDEFLAMTLRDIRPEEDIPRLLADVEETSQSLNFAGEWRHRKKDGSVFPVAITSHTITYHERPARLVVAVDVSEQKRAEEALRESEERYHHISEMISDYAYAFEVGEEGELRLEWVVGNFEGITGYTIAEYETLGGWPILIYPEDMPIALARAERLMSGQYDVSEFRILRKDGQTRWVRDHGYPVWDEKLGRVVRIYGAAQDITERKRRELELEALAQVGQALGESLELEPLAERFIQAGLHAIPSAEKGSLALLVEGQKLEVKAQVGYADESVKGFTYPIHWGFAGRAFREQQALLIEDVEQDELLRQNGASATSEEVREIRSAVVAPLIARGESIGVISFESSRPGVFNQDDLRTLNNVATTLGLVIQNSRLFEETLRQAEKNAALLETAQAAAKLELDHLLQTVGERMKRLFSADSCLVYLLEEGGQTLRCVLADHPEGEQIRRISLPIGEGVIGAIAQSGEAEIVHDMTADPRSMHVPDTADEPEAMMFAPLVAKGERIGIMSVSRQGRERPFNGDDLELFKAVASQVAVAILNAHYYEETRRRLNILESLQRVSNALREAQTFDEALPIVMDETLAVLGTDSGMIRLYDSQSDQWIVRVSRGWLSRVKNMPVSRDEGFVGRALQLRQPYRIRDYARDELTPEKFKEYIPEGWSGAAIPILTEVQPLGVMLVAVPHPRQISDEELTLLRSVADMAGTALQRMRLHEEALRRVEQLQALQTVDKAITSTLDIHVMLGVLIQQASAQLGGDAIGILLYTPSLQMLEAAAGRGFQTRQYERTRFPVGESLAGRAVITRQPVLLTDVEGESSSFLQMLKAEGFSTYLAAPLIAKGLVKGVMEVFYRTPFRPDADWLSMFEMLAGQAAIAIDNAQMFDDLQRANLKLSVAYDATIEGWSKTLEMRDKETEGHTQRVTHLTLQLAERLGVSAEMLPHIRRGCILHDIGKMAVPDSILLKPGPLTEEEWAVMHTHPALAYEMLLPIEYLQPALDIPYCHHEKWDGTGYPRGLKGASIPLPARIFAVVDVWDALTSDRPYRKAWSRTEAMMYIRDQAGRHFDPRVVEEFLKLMSGGE